MPDLQTFFDNADDAVLKAHFATIGRSGAELTVPWLDGYLVAVAVSPEVVPQQEWLAFIWDGSEPAYDDADTARVVEIMLSRLEDIVDRVQDGSYQPRLGQAADGGIAAADSAGEWADGFMAGYGLRSTAWMPLLRQQNGPEFLLPIVALCRDSDEIAAVQLDAELEIEIHEHAPVMLRECVLDIADFWRERHYKRHRTRHPGMSAPGRNAPCPCGSGRKFKKCCGAAA